MVLILATGLPGFLLFFLHLLPWSAISVAAWAIGAELITRSQAGQNPEPMPAAVWGCLSLPLMLVAFAAPFADHWHPAATAMVFWAPPTLLGVLATRMALHMWRRGQRLRAAFGVPLLYQLQLMFCGGLFALARLFYGGSPI